MPTIYDVAKTSGVSPATVSRVINGRKGVKTRTLERIQQAMDSLNFQPRWKAVNRKRIMVLVPEHKNSLRGGYVSNVLSGIADVFFKEGHSIVIRPFHSEKMSRTDLHQLLITEGVSGCMLISLPDGYELAEEVGMERIPHVIIGYKHHEDPLNQVLLEDYAAGKEATLYLQSLGHRKIALIYFGMNDFGHQQRLQGYLDAMKDTEIEETEVIQAKSGEGAKIARKLLGRASRPTGVIITNEKIALEFQQEVKEMGLGIPEDVSIIGFEDSEVLAMMNPPLSVIKIPSYEMGEKAALILLDLMKDESTDRDVSFETFRIPAALEIRRSTAKLHK